MALLIATVVTPHQVPQQAAILKLLRLWGDHQRVGRQAGDAVGLGEGPHGAEVGTEPAPTIDRKASGEL